MFRGTEPASWPGQKPLVESNKNKTIFCTISSILLVPFSLKSVALFSQKGVALKYSSSGMTETPPTQSCSQTCCKTSFMKNQSCPGGHFFMTGCLENTASLAKSSSSGPTSTILPVKVSLAHLGSSGS